MIVRTVLFVLLGWASLACLSSLQGNSERVVILANANSSKSVSVARYYARQRQIPEENILALKMPNKAIINWQEYATTIHNPLMETLIEKGWINAVPLHSEDVYGRKRYQATTNKISYLVTVFGVPLKIARSPHSQQAPDNIPPIVKTDAAAVDSELSLLLIPIPHAVGPSKNPLFQNKTPPTALERSIIKVGRLDGRSAQDAQALVDRALAGEAKPVWGRAYVDITGKHATGNQWMRETARLLQNARWDVVARNTKGTFRGTDRFDAPFFYFGWYTDHINGPFIEPFMSFAPGAIAFHLHSFSANQLTNTTQNWCAGLIHKGAAVTLGNVYEPTLGFSLHPHLFVEALLAGQSVGEAAYYAQPTLSWQGVLLGDPLYRPNFGDAVDTPTSPLAQGYAWARRFLALQREGRTQQAREIGKRFLQQTPHLPLAWLLAQMPPQADSTTTLDWIRDSIAEDNLLPEQAGLIREVARALHQQGTHTESLRLYHWLIHQVSWSKASYAQLLNEAIAMATEAQAEDDIRFFSDLLPPVEPQPQEQSKQP